MKTYIASPAYIARFRTLCLVMIGAFAVMLIQAIQDLLFIPLGPASQRTFAAYALSGTAIVMLSLALVVCYRCGRHGKLPGVTAILTMMTLLTVVIVLGRLL